MTQTGILLATCAVLFLATGTMAGLFGAKKEDDVKKDTYGTFETKDARTVQEEREPGMKDKVKDMFGMNEENKDMPERNKKTTTSTTDKRRDEQKDVRSKSEETKRDTSKKDTKDKIHEGVKDVSENLNEKIKGASEFMDEKVKGAADFVDDKVQDASDYVHEKVKSDKRDDTVKTEYSKDVQDRRQQNVNEFGKQDEQMKEVQGKLFEKDASGNLHERDTAGKLYEDKNAIHEKQFRSGMISRALEKIKDVFDPQDGTIDIYGRQITYKIKSHSHLLSSKSYDCSMTDVPTKITVESKNWKDPKEAFEHCLDDELLPKLKQRGVVV